MDKKIKKGVFTVAGATLMGLSLNLFLIPMHIAAGGVGGAATVINYLTGVSVGILILIINIPIFLLGALHFSKRFLFYSLLGTMSLSASTQFFSFLPAMTSDLLLAAVFGGAGSGLGIGLVLMVNGSTGGTDILALVLKKRFPSFSVGQFFLMIDGLVIVGGRDCLWTVGGHTVFGAHTVCQQQGG